MWAELKPKDSLEFGDLLMGEEFGVVHTEVRVIILMEVSGILLLSKLIYFLVSLFNLVKWEPVIVSFVKIFEVDVVAVGVLVFGFGGVVV